MLEISFIQNSVLTWLVIRIIACSFFVIIFLLLMLFRKLFAHCSCYSGNIGSHIHTIQSNVSFEFSIHCFKSFTHLFSIFIEELGLFKANCLVHVLSVWSWEYILRPKSMSWKLNWCLEFSGSLIISLVLVAVATTCALPPVKAYCSYHLTLPSIHNLCCIIVESWRAKSHLCESTVLWLLTCRLFVLE